MAKATILAENRESTGYASSGQVAGAITPVAISAKTCLTDSSTVIATLHIVGYHNVSSGLLSCV